MGRRTRESILESQFQAHLVNRLGLIFPGCYIIFQDPQDQQGIPDLLILFRNKWAMLEVKASATAAHQPNQDYWVEHFGHMAFTAFIYPENEEDVLYELEQALRSRRATRVLVGK